MFTVGVDLGQSQDFTAICILEKRQEATKGPPARLENHYQLRYLRRPPLGTKYPAIVADVLALLGRPPLTRSVPLVVDKTGVGAAVVDLFAASGVRPHAITITGGDDPNTEDKYNIKVPKRDLVGTLVALFQTGRLKVADGLELAPVLVNELVNFRIKVNLATGHDSYEAWRESVHDDLVLSVALAAWYAENMAGTPFRCAVGPQRPQMQESYDTRWLRTLPRGGKAW